MIQSTIYWSILTKYKHPLFLKVYLYHTIKSLSMSSNKRLNMILTPDKGDIVCIFKVNILFNQYHSHHVFYYNGEISTFKRMFFFLFRVANSCTLAVHQACFKWAFYENHSRLHNTQAFYDLDLNLESEINKKILSIIQINVQIILILFYCSLLLIFLCIFTCKGKLTMIYHL